ncbi:uncharacterized protein [Diadema setosum]|uniref:uncharacterized protein n=1 Tax=Diadema setosum TaxID=31175 RepID=UPI003B3A7270
MTVTFSSVSPDEPSGPILPLTTTTTIVLISLIFPLVLVFILTCIFAYHRRLSREENWYPPEQADYPSVRKFSSKAFAVAPQVPDPPQRRWSLMVIDGHHGNGDWTETEKNGDEFSIYETVRTSCPATPTTTSVSEIDKCWSSDAASHQVRVEVKANDLDDADDDPVVGVGGGQPLNSSIDESQNSHTYVSKSRFFSHEPIKQSESEDRTCQTNRTSITTDV